MNCSKWMSALTLMGMVVHPACSGADDHKINLPAMNGVVEGNTDNDGNLVLPVDILHRFTRVQPNWVKKVTYLEPTTRKEDFNGSYIERKPEQREANKLYYKEVKYFEPGDQGNDLKYAKEIRYYPSGLPESVSDRIGNEDFVLSLDEHKCVKQYRHLQGYKLIDAYSISPDKKKVSKLLRGTGSLILWGDDEESYQEHWYYDGVNYLIKKYQRGADVRIKLWVPERLGGMVFSKQGEELRFSADGSLKSLNRMEQWYKKAGQKPVGVTPRLFYTASSANKPFPKLKPEAYTSRRATFVEEYGRFLATIGQSWKSLRIEDVKSGA